MLHFPQHRLSMEDIFVSSYRIISSHAHDDGFDGLDQFSRIHVSQYSVAIGYKKSIEDNIFG